MKKKLLYRPDSLLDVQIDGIGRENEILKWICCIKMLCMTTASTQTPTHTAWFGKVLSDDPRVYKSSEGFSVLIYNIIYKMNIIWKPYIEVNYYLWNTQEDISNNVETKHH